MTFKKGDKLKVIDTVVFDEAEILKRGTRGTVIEGEKDGFLVFVTDEGEEWCVEPNCVKLEARDE